MQPKLVRLSVAIVILAALAASPLLAETESRPNVLIVTVDTLRADRLSAYGYERPTSPNIDELIEGGVVFDQGRTVEPLTAPALSSLITSQYPHDHGASRNGLRMRSGLASLPKTLQAQGYRSAAFVSNWTLRDKLCGMAEHFDTYEEVLTKRRWFGLIRGEATAEDITANTLGWIDGHLDSDAGTPFVLWAHYTEPHAPYKLHSEFTERLGLASRNLSASDRYDTEIAAVDAEIGELIDALKERSLFDDTMIVFAADHGESLGEHGYWGHGRHLYEPSLRIPLALTWKGHVSPRRIESPALIIDLAPTILGLLDVGGPGTFQGYDWSGVLAGGAEPTTRITRYEAHRGAVISKHDSELARRSGLLSVGLIGGSSKEIFRVERNNRLLFDLRQDPAENHNLNHPREDPTEGLLDWMRLVYTGLTSSDIEPPEPLDPESIEQLRSLGYVD
ncbi:MAG: sulfatase [bacterium]|nr:sulfatase [bacterium]